ncbi:MAG: histidine phosphatase family protein [Pseudomonadota bacterium]
MGEIYLVRHGQASLGAENYDELSELGHQQSRWLGEYFAERDIAFDEVVVGGQHRHQQTLDGIAAALALPAAQQRDAGLNEFEFQRLIQAYLAANPGHPVPDPRDIKGIFSTFRLAMHAWANEELPGGMDESLADFCARVAQAYRSILAGDAKRRVLVVTSGGPISIIMKEIMGFGIDTLIGLQIQSKNTAVNHLYFNPHTTYVTSFNHVPHLDQPGRLDAITNA